MHRLGGSVISAVDIEATSLAKGESIADMAKVLGPYAFAEGAGWAPDEGIFEVNQRSGVCFAPGGTPEALKIVISRALAVGR